MDKINPIEKFVIFGAIGASAIHLALIAFAAFQLNITVADCVDDLESFQTPALIKHDDKRYEVHYVARMWAFEPRVLKVPVGSTVDIFLTSVDVNHGFHIAGTNVNVTAIPNIVGNATVTFAHPGTYHLVCHEYCGVGHQDMGGFIEVSDEIDEAEGDNLFLQDPANLIANRAARQLDSPAADPAYQLLVSKGCTACHTVDGTQLVGPSFKGIYGSQREFQDGTQLVVDTAYLKESISYPDKKVVSGYSIPMPALPINDDELTQIVKYLEKL